MSAKGGANSSRAMIAAFSPRSVAVVGASNDPNRIGGRPIAFSSALGFSGKLYPVNPGRETVQGLRCYPDIAAIPDAIDLAVIAVAASEVHAAVMTAAAKGAATAIILSSGFSEHSIEGAAMERALVASAQEAGIRLLGPNCLGVFNADTGLAGTFASFLQEQIAAKGGVALVSQSGAYNSYIYMLARRRGIAVGRWISTGNEADLHVSDAIAHLAGDDSVRVIGCVLEGVTDGVRLMDALRVAADAGKPVVILKMARSSNGIQAAASHTAALAVDDVVFDAAVRQAGAIRVASTEGMLDLLYAFSMAPPPAGDRLAIVSMSGGAGVLMADAAEDAGLTLAAIPRDVKAGLKAANPLGHFANPIDLTGAALNDPSLIGAPLEAMLSDPGVDLVVGFFLNWVAAPGIGDKVCDAIIGSVKACPARSLALVVTAPDDIVARLEAAGIMVFTDPARAVAALGALVRTARHRRPVVPFTGRFPKIEGGTKSEVAAKRLLADAGFRILDERTVHSADEAADAAATIAGAVALKIVSPDLPHKTDVGGVVLGVAGCEAVRRETAAMLERVRKARPDARIDGVLVSPMVPDGLEMIIAVRCDPTFGPVVVVGMGGIHVEVLRDIAVRIGAIDDAEARVMLNELKARALLDGVRGRPAADIAALASAISLLSRLGMANSGRFGDIEINPLRVGARGEGYFVLDALITPGSDTERC